ncbi:MAG: HAD family hydrolase [Alphaproteobacteria bacterium]|nr:HAD family hydrolase [Alphaproteobacteria bacterium]
MNLSIPRAVIFDWDNTLVDVWGVITESINEVRTAFKQDPWSVPEAKQHCTKALRYSFPEWYGDEWPKARMIFYDRYHQTHLDHLNVMPGAAELMAWLDERKVPAFVVSNKRGDDLRAEAEHLGWTGRFVAIVGSMDAPRDKPERDPVDLALGRAGLKADDPSIWFVGDTHADVECARNSGCTPVLVHNPGEALRMGVDLSFSDCQGLLELLYNMDQPIAGPGKRSGRL